MWPVASALAVLVVSAAALLLRPALAPSPRRPVAPSPARASAPDISPVEADLRADLARRPRDARAHAILAKYLLDSDRPFEALWHFRVAQELAPGVEAHALGTARALAAAGLPARARELLGARPDPQTLAGIALATARPQEAAAALGGKAREPSAEAQLLLGDAALALGDAARARAAYERAIALDPQSADARDRFGRALMAMGNWEAAKAAFAQTRELAPARPGPTFRFGLACARAGESTGRPPARLAEQIWQSVVSGAPGYAPAHRELGKSALRRRDLPAAAAHLVAAVRADSASEEAQLALAEVMSAQGDRASALYQRGFAYLQNDQPHRALAEFRRMIALAPDRVDGPLMTSFAYIQMQRLDLAAAEAERGRKRHPDDPRLLARLAMLHVLGRNRPLAKQLCESWRQRDPGAVEPLRILGRVAREEQRLSDSLQFLEQALARESENGMVSLEAAKTLAAMGGPENVRRGLQYAHKAAAINARDAESWHQYGVLLRTAGQPDAAAEALTRALDRDATSVASGSLLVQIAGQQQLPETARFFAGLVTALEERARTEKALWRAVYGRPDDAEAHARLADFLLGGGDLRRGRNQLRQVAALRPGDAAVRETLRVVDRLLELKSD
jgi:tetratricopeptide (TPR) repeat protein